MRDAKDGTSLVRPHRNGATDAVSILLLLHYLSLFPATHVVGEVQHLMLQGVCILIAWSPQQLIQNSAQLDCHSCMASHRNECGGKCNGRPAQQAVEVAVLQSFIVGTCPKETAAGGI